MLIKRTVVPKNLCADVVACTCFVLHGDLISALFILTDKDVDYCCSQLLLTVRLVYREAAFLQRNKK